MRNKKATMERGSCDDCTLGIVQGPLNDVATVIDLKDILYRVYYGGLHQKSCTCARPMPRPRIMNPPEVPVHCLDNTLRSTSK